MLKNIFRLVLGVLMLVAPGSLLAQEANPMLQPMPLMPGVRTGVLPNGLTYYILHNEEPKGRANFYIAQKVGSTLENPQQLGLAHFLEHMAFNGTQNYPGKNMLNYLQSKSLRFGADINAYTGFDETVYNIDNVQTADQNLMDSVLLVLRDWSCAITLDSEEIDAERKVIQEEWRMRNDASTRFYTQLLPNVYQEYQYHQMPIGSMDIVMNFPYDDLRSYYKKWYRPDQQGIIIVGDFDAEAMETKVKNLFSDIKMPADAAPRLYPSVSDNKEPIYFQYADKEAPHNIVFIAFKKDETPREQRNTMAYWVNDLAEDLITTMIDNRLDEFSQKPECEYTSAGVYYGDFWVSSTKDAFNIQIQPKGSNTAAATQQAMEIIARACKTGFTESEYERAKNELQSVYERRYNERNKTQNRTLGQKLIRHFIDNTTLGGPEIDMQLFNAVSAQIPVAMLNKEVTELLTPENQCVVVFMPEKEGYTLPGKEAMLSVIEGAMGKEYEAYKDEVITEPLIAKLPKPGTVKKVYDNKTFGTKEFTLSNGVKVILKTTDFADDEIQFSCLASGGYELFNPADKQACMNMGMMNVAIESSKQGNFTNTMMTRYLSGKMVGVSFTLRGKTQGLMGASVKKDFPTMMELIYSYFTQINPDEEQYATDLKKECIKLEQAQNDVNTAWRDSLTYAMYSNDARFAPSTVAGLKGANYTQMVNKCKEMLSNAADYTFIFVGNVDEATLRPLMEQYIATLPSKKKASKPAQTWPIKFYTGNRTIAFDQPMNTPGTFYYGMVSGPAKADAINAINSDIAGDILSNLFTEIIREKEGAAYSPGAFGQLLDSYGRWQITSVIQTNREQQQRAFELAQQELDKILKGEVSEEQFQKVKGAAINQYDIQLRKNSFWMSTLRDNVLGIDTYNGHREELQNLTLDAFKKWLKSLKTQNSLTVIRTGIPEKK